MWALKLTAQAVNRREYALKGAVSTANLSSYLCGLSEAQSLFSNKEET
jgi:hypothetical protein